MKILEINKFYFIKGGAEKHFFNLIDLLKDNNHQVAVFSMKHPKNEKSKWEKYFLSTVGYDGSYSFWQKLKGVGRMFYSWEAKKKINKILDDFQPDIVHIHNIYHQLSPSILFEIKKRNIPIVMTVHDYKLVNPNYNLYHQQKFYNRCLNYKYYQCVLDKCVKNSYLKSFLAMLEMYWHHWLGTYEKNIDQYIVPSKFAKNILTKRGIPKNKIIVLPHFIQEKFDNNKNREVINKVNKEKYCLYVGRVISNKGIEDLVNLFEKVVGLKLYLAGAIDNDFHKISNNNVRYLGHLEQVDLIQYIQDAQFIISPSQLPETFGLVALEANANGKLFVGYNTGAYSEIIESKKNGVLVNNRQDLLQTINKLAKTKINKIEDAVLRKEIQQKYNAKNYQKQLTKIFKYAIIKH